MTAPEPVSLGAYLLGATWLAAVLAACLAASVVALRRRRDLEPPYRVVATAALALAVVIVVHLVPGAAGVLGRGTVLLTAGIVLAVALVVDRRRGRRAAHRRAGDRRDDRGSLVDWLPAAAGVAVVVGFALAFLDARHGQAIDEVDSLMFHLPQVVRWIQTNSFWQVDDFAPGWAFGNYPNSGNILQLAVVLPWRDDALVRFVNLPLLLLAGAGVAVTAWELGVRRPTAVVAGALAMSVPVLLTVSVNAANTDPIAYAGFAVAAAFLARAFRSERRGDLALAGVGLGLGVGSKWYGLSSATVLVAMWTVWRLARLGPGRWRTVGLDVLALGAGSVVLAGFWFVRNLALSGNPVFPVRVALGDVVLFDAPPDHIRERLGSSILDYAGDLDILRDYVWLGFRVSFSWPGALAVAGVAAALVVAWRARRSLPAAAAVAAVALTALYVATPYTAMGPAGDPYLIGAATRYAGPAFALAVPAAAWALSRADRRVVRAGEWLAVVAVAAGIRRAAELLGIEVGDVVTARRVLVLVALVAVAVVVAVTMQRRRRAGAVAVRILGVTVAVAVAVGAVAVGRLVQENVRTGRYAGVDPVYDALLAAAPAGHTVALAGEYGGVNPPPLILHGYRFGNRVVYVGPVVEERLERHRDGDAFRRGLARTGADYLVVALGSPARPDLVAPEERWARQAGWEPVVRSDRLALLRR